VNTSRVPAAMIDNTALLAAATFLEVNGFTCNIEIRESTNYSDFVARLAPYFLLSESNAGGKRGLRPLLPVTAGGAIKTTAITADYTFTEDTVLPGTFEINYLSLADKQPFVAQVIWRQQLESDIGIIRTAEVRYSGTAETGPYESHDLSTFCTSEDHAVKVGAYILAKRMYTTHTIRFAARPQEHNIIITAGDIIRVRLARDNTTYANSVHDYLYQVERITKTLAGDVNYEATHFPIDDQGRSLIALDVAAAVGTGSIIPSGRTGVSCDANSSSDGSIPSEEFANSDGSTSSPTTFIPFSELQKDNWVQQYQFAGGGGLGFKDSAPTGGTGNTDDGLDAGGFPPNTVFPAGVPAGIGSALYPFDGATGPCGAGNLESITWYKDGVKIATVNYSGGTYTYVAEPGQYMPAWLSTVSATPGVLVAGINGAGVYTSITRCADGSQYGRSTTVSDSQPYAPGTTCGMARYRFMMSNSASIFAVPAGAPPFVEQTDPAVNVVRGVDCSGNVTNSWGVISWNPITSPGVSLSMVDLQITYNSGVTWTTWIDYTSAP
jgi:hypothetical protein